MKRLLSVLAVALLALPAQAEPTAFGLFGDTPYNHWELEHLPDLIAEMDGEKLAFVVHDGDIKSGSGVCSDELLQGVLAVFKKSAAPLVYVLRSSPGSALRGRSCRSEQARRSARPGACRSIFRPCWGR